MRGQPVAVISAIVLKWLIPARWNRVSTPGQVPILDLRTFAGYLAKEMSPPQNSLYITEECADPAQHAVATRAEIPKAIPSLLSYYTALLAAYGPQNWWPGRTRFEVIAGAILTQNTAWSNVTLALGNLRRERLLNASAIASVSLARLERLIRSSGYFRQKAKTLKAFVRFLRTEYAGSLTEMFRTPTATLRHQLLAVRGIGPETADCSLLNAGKHPVFVGDAYTRRILERHGHTHTKASYDEIRASFERSIPADAAIYNEFHALIVQAGKEFCRRTVPDCNACPLHSFLPTAGLST